MFSIEFNNKNSFKDFGLTIISKNIAPPKKIKIKETVPFMNGTYDFSSIYLNQLYEERSLTYTFNVIGSNKIDMNSIRSEVEEWLSTPEKTKLKDDVFPGVYFLAEAEDIKFDEDGRIATMTVEFIAYPFKIGEHLEGSDIWDDFNFTCDYAQDTKFEVNGLVTIDIVNASIVTITPTVVCDSDIEVTKDGITYLFKEGETTDYRFILNKGKNTFKISGNGYIDFRFRKEIL
ncbi:MAG: phage tail protein [Clostridium sp.]